MTEAGDRRGGSCTLSLWCLPRSVFVETPDERLRSSRRQAFAKQTPERQTLARAMCRGIVMSDGDHLWSCRLCGALSALLTATPVALRGLRLRARTRGSSGGAFRWVWRSSAN
jgi:hypothetical protein